MAAIGLDELDGATTGNVCDAQGKTGQMGPAIKPVYGGAKLLGPAYPVRSTGADNLAWHRAIELAPAGSVLVAATGAYVGAGFFGAVMATACRARGIAGLVTDGACRDCDELEAMGFPVFAAGASPGGTAKLDFGDVGVPVECGGVTVRPGDVVFGDRDGVVVVAAEQAEAVFARARATVEREATVREQLSQGLSTMDIFGFPRPAGGR
jgi:4-hydroxy-4-methyl-2-oxoglutarate aldolase